MGFRTPGITRWLAGLLVIFVTLSAQAWASHVDWPASHSTDHAHVETTVFDDAPPLAHDGASGEADHCCHAAAHLVGLRSSVTEIALNVSAPRATARESRYASLVHPPLIDPPIV